MKTTFKDERREAAGSVHTRLLVVGFSQRQSFSLSSLCHRLSSSSLWWSEFNSSSRDFWGWIKWHNLSRCSFSAFSTSALIHKDVMLLPFHALLDNKHDIQCNSHIDKVSGEIVCAWKERNEISSSLSLSSSLSPQLIIKMTSIGRDKITIYHSSIILIHSSTRILYVCRCSDVISFIRALSVLLFFHFHDFSSFWFDSMFLLQCVFAFISSSLLGDPLWNLTKFNFRS